MPDQAQLAMLRAALEQEHEHLRAQLAELEASSDTALSFDEGFADSGQVAAEQGEVKVLVGKLREQLADVERALAKLDEGGYGLCERCHEPITEARLEAMPAARHCINHA